MFEGFLDLFFYKYSILIAIVFVAIFSYLIPLYQYFISLFSGAYISLISLIMMRIRRVPLDLIVDSYITAVKAGIKILSSDLENHYLASGNVRKVVQALISAKKAKIELSFDNAAAIDLAGRDVLQAVKNSVSPIVIDSPLISAVSNNGIELIIKARVTIKTNIQNLVGGAGEQTILARVGESIIKAVGSAKDHNEILSCPENISKMNSMRNLGDGTAFDILSVDIAEIKVGENIGAKLQNDQANTDLNIANANAEGKKAMALALLAELKAKEQQMKNDLILKEQEILLATAEALRNGNIGVLDYLKMKNIESDTKMKESIAECDLINKKNNKENNPKKG